MLRSARQYSCVSPRVLTDRGVVQVCGGGEKLVLGAERILTSAFNRRRWWAQIIRRGEMLAELRIQGSQQKANLRFTKTRPDKEKNKNTRFC